MIYNTLFNSNLNTLAVQLLPVKWRKPINIAFIQFLIIPFKIQFKRLKSERQHNIYLLEHDARVGRLEKVLNDAFDPINRCIRIGKGNRIQSLYLYKKSEAQQSYLPKVVYTQKEIKDRNTDFIILMPKNILFDEKKVTYITRYYTGKDKQFKVVLTDYNCNENNTNTGSSGYNSSGSSGSSGSLGFSHNIGLDLLMV